MAAYRREIALYLEAIKLARGWKNVEMGARAGKLSHSTIGRALKQQHTLAFPALLALEQQSGVEIPASLRGAAIAAQQPTTTQPPISPPSVAAFESMSPEAQRALLQELHARLKATG